jgi:hypothetical protein
LQLFSDITRTDSGPRRYIESSAEYLDRSAQPEAANIRRLLEDWFSRYPLEHRMELHGRLCSADDTEHHAATFELALHELLMRLGMTLEVHPCAETDRGRPEFWARTAAGETFLLEAVTASLSSAQNRRADRLIDTVYDQINQLDSPNFFLHLRSRGNCYTQPSGQRLRSFLQENLEQVDPDCLIDMLQNGQSLPVWVYRHEGLELRFTPIPKKPEARGKPNISPLGMYSRGHGVWVASLLPAIVKVLKTKGNKYGVPKAPFIIAMNGLSPYISWHECARALFGSGKRVLSEVSQIEAGEAFWLGSSGPTYTRVSAVLFVESLIPWTLAVCEATLFYNPWAVRPLQCELDQLPHVIVAEEGRLERRQGKRLSAIWGLNEGWPRHAAT